MKFKIEFSPSEYFAGKNAYSLSVCEERNRQDYGYWKHLAFFEDVETAKTRAKVIKEKLQTIEFEV